jgi:hypothetical protein
VKKCLYCAEEIQDEAIKCKYCHQDLNSPESQKIEKNLKEASEKRASKTFLKKNLKAHWKYALGAIVIPFAIANINWQAGEAISGSFGLIGLVALLGSIFTPTRYKATVVFMAISSLLLGFSLSEISSGGKRKEEEKRLASDPVYRAKKDKEKADQVARQAQAEADTRAEEARTQAENQQKAQEEAAAAAAKNQEEAEELAQAKAILDRTLIENGAVGYTVDKVYTAGLLNPSFSAELAEAIRLNDVEGMEAMTNAGKIAMIPPKTKVRKLGIDESAGVILTHFRVMEGDYRTLDFYVTPPWLVKKKGEYLRD